MPTNKASGAGDDESKAPTTKLTKITKPKPKPPKVKPTIMGKETPPEVQAQIIAALLSGQFPHDSDIAKDIGVSKGLVSKIKKAIPKEYLEQVQTVKKEKVGELVIQFLEGALESLMRIDAITLNEEWLLRQDAPGIAVFYGVKADKIAKILEAIERANEPAVDEIPGTEG